METVGVPEPPATDAVTRKVTVLPGMMVRVLGFTVRVKLPPPGGPEEPPPPQDSEAQVKIVITTRWTTRRTNRREHFIPPHLSVLEAAGGRNCITILAFWRVGHFNDKV
jgi:hypothetical protein